MRPSGNQVKAARGLLGISSAQLAKAAGCSLTTLEQFEAGRTAPYERTIAKIVEALEIRGISFSNGDKPTVSLDKSKAVIPIGT